LDICNEASGSSIAKIILLSLSLFFNKNEYATSIKAFRFSPELNSETGIDFDPSTFQLNLSIRNHIIFAKHFFSYFLFKVKNTKKTAQKNLNGFYLFKNTI